MTASSYAKINLGLKVLGKRPDGFHDIISVFHEVDLADEITLSPSESGRIRVTSSSSNAPDGPGNLAYQAAEVLRRSVDRPELGVDICILKRIPTGGGLGGGSSNAGLTLCELNRIWNLGLPNDRLLDVAASVGSDVPFFVQGGAALVTGRGETIQPGDSTGDPAIVLVDPGFAVSTPWAFGKLNIGLTRSSPYIRFLNSVRTSGQVDLLDLFSLFENDFLPLVGARYPSVQRILSLIRESGALGASMSGTGATLYGGFARASDAQEAADRLQDQGYTVHLCRPVRRLSRS